MEPDLSDTQAFEYPLAGFAQSAAKTESSFKLPPTVFKDVFCFKASGRRMIAGFTGPLLLGLGSGISVSAGFGSFGFAVLLDGIQTTVGMPLWLSQIIMTVLFYVLAWFWARIPLGMGTLPTLLLIGPVMSLGAMFTPESLPILGHMIAFAIGLFLFAAGISFSAAAALGPDGVTALSLAAEKRHRLPVPKATFIWNASAIVLGIVLGGSYGVATFVGLATVPVIIQLMLPWLRRQIH